MFCKYCGNKMDDSAKFCENCGAQNNSVNASNSANVMLDGEKYNTSQSPTTPDGQQYSNNQSTVTNTQNYYGGQQGQNPYSTGMYQDYNTVNGTKPEVKFGGSVKAWFIICAVANFIFAIINGLSYYGQDMKIPYVLLFAGLSAAFGVCYILLLTIKTKVMYWLIVAVAAISMFTYIFLLGSFQFGCIINPLITIAVLSPYWKNMN